MTKTLLLAGACMICAASGAWLLMAPAERASRPLDETDGLAAKLDPRRPTSPDSPRAVRRAAQAVPSGGSSEPSGAIRRAEISAPRDPSPAPSPLRAGSPAPGSKREVGPDPRAGTPRRSGPPALGSVPASDEPPIGDPDALAAWFQARVLAELEPAPASSASGDTPLDDLAAACAATGNCAPDAEQRSREYEWLQERGHLPSGGPATESPGYGEIWRGYTLRELRAACQATGNCGGDFL